MTRPLNRQIAAHACAVALAVLSDTVGAQATLGELLDAGAQRMSGREFNDEVAGRLVVGPLPTGGEVDMLYAPGGRVVGRGTFPRYQSQYQASSLVEGIWRIDDGERVCVTMSMGAQTFPPRCQYWFKLADTYYLADSDTDRRARILRRNIKK